jgi:MFS family permease
MSVTRSETINWRAAGAAIGAISVVGTALGLGIPLLSVLMEKQGHSATIIGAQTALGGVAALVAAPFGPKIAQYLGLNRAMALMIIIVAACFLSFNAFRYIEIWFALRFVMTFAVTSLFVFSEFWISAAAPPAKRGFLLGVYATVLSLGFAIGPLLFSQIGSDGGTAFYIGAAIVLAALVPVFIAWGDGVEVEEGGVGGFLPYVWLVPTATAAVLIYGAVETGSFSLFPVYGVRLSMPEADVALLLTAIGLGNVMLQIPLGYLSDSVKDRRLVMLGCAVIGFSGMVLLPFAIQNWWLAAAIMFVWGGVVAGLYTVGLAHLASRTPPAALAQANAAFVFCYGAGMLLGPQAIGAAMDVFGPDGFAYAIAGFFGLFIALTAVRITLGR